MTERDEREAPGERETRTDRGTTADVSHANPYTGDTLGDLFVRGAVAADGGRTSVADETRDVAHEAPHGGGTNRMWTRGATETTDTHTAADDVSWEDRRDE